MKVALMSSHCTVIRQFWVFNSGRLGVNTPKNFSPYAQILRRGRHDVQINLLQLRFFVYNKLEIDVRICFPMFRWFNNFCWLSCFWILHFM